MIYFNFSFLIPFHSWIVFVRVTASSIFTAQTKHNRKIALLSKPSKSNFFAPTIFVTSTYASEGKRDPGRQVKNLPQNDIYQRLFLNYNDSKQRLVKGMPTVRRKWITKCHSKRNLTLNLQQHDDWQTSALWPLLGAVVQHRLWHSPMNWVGIATVRYGLWFLWERSVCDQ